MATACLCGVPVIRFNQDAPEGMREFRNDDNGALETFTPRACDGAR